MVFKFIVFAAVLTTALIQAADLSPWAGPAKQAFEIISKLTEENKVIVENRVGEQIYLKCASADDDIGWHTLEPDQV